MSLPPAFSKNNSIIYNGQVLSSKIDMDSEKITSLATPTSGLDAVNKDYCDQNSANGIPSITVTLSGTTWNTILSDTSGVFDILIRSLVTNGPTAKFTILKSNPISQASIQRWGCTAGTTSLERLEMRWLPSTGIQLRKNGSGYNGQYKLRYFSL